MEHEPHNDIPSKLKRISITTGTRRFTRLFSFSDDTIISKPPLNDECEKKELLQPQQPNNSDDDNSFVTAASHLESSSEPASTASTLSTMEATAWPIDLATVETLQSLSSYDISSSNLFSVGPIEEPPLHQQNLKDIAQVQDLVLEDNHKCVVNRLSNIYPPSELPYLKQTSRRGKRKDGTQTTFRYQGRCVICKKKTTHQCSKCDDNPNIDGDGWCCHSINNAFCFSVHIKEVHNVHVEVSPLTGAPTTLPLLKLTDKFKGTSAHRFQGRCMVCKLKTIYQCSQCSDNKNIAHDGWCCHFKTGRSCYVEHCNKTHTPR